MTPVSVLPSLGIRMHRYQNDWLVQAGPPPGSRGCLVPLSQVGDSGQPGVVPSLRLRWYIISGWSSTHRLLWPLHRQIASPGCSPPPTNSVLRSASCLLVAVTSGVAVLSVTSGSRWLKGGEGARLVSCSRHRCPAVPPLGGISSAPLFLPGIRNVLADSLPPSPAPRFRMVSQLGRISIFAALVAGDVRPVCHFRPSPLLHLFSPYRDPLSAGMDALLQSWDGLLACAFPPWSVLPGCWRSLGCLTGPSSPSSPSTGLSVLGSWPSSSCRWLLQCLFQHTQTSSSSLGLVAATRVSTGWPFLPGDCPAPHQGSWFLLGGGCAGFVGAPSIIALHLPAQVVGLPVMVPLSGPLHLAAIPLQGNGFPLVASIGSGP